MAPTATSWPSRVAASSFESGDIEPSRNFDRVQETVHRSQLPGQQQAAVLGPDDNVAGSVLTRNLV